MQIASLQRFVEIAQAGSLYQAAKRTGISVQSYAKSLNSLEKELGKTLAERSRAGIRLTLEGSLLLQFAMNATAQFDAVKQAMDELPADDLSPESQITVFATPYLMRVFSLFVDEYSLLFRYRWHQESFEKLLLRLPGSRPNGIFAAEIFSHDALQAVEQDGIVATPFYRTVLGLILREDSPHAAEKKIGRDAVAKMPLCLYPQKERNAHRNLVFRNAPLTNVVVESESTEMLAGFVRDNPQHGCLSDSYMFHSLQRTHADTKDLRFIPLDCEEASSYLCLLEFKGASRSTQSEHFVNLLLGLSKSHYADYSRTYPIDSSAWESMRSRIP